MDVVPDLSRRQLLLRAAVTLSAMAPYTARSAMGDADWRQFRGQTASGIGLDPRLPEAWSAADAVVWKAAIPGRGWSSPIVVGKRVFLTAAVKDGAPMEAARKGLYFGGERAAPKDAYRWLVLCLDIGTGKMLWQREAHRGVPAFGFHVKNSPASETPASDGERIYAYFGNVGAFCYDLAGKRLWSKTWEAVPTRFGWGHAASPVLHGDRLFIVNDNDRQSFMVALDRKTGRQVWRVERDEKSNWATPFIWKHRLRTEIVTVGTGAVRSYDLDGRALWTLRRMSSISIPTPVAGNGLLFVSSGYVGDKHRPIYAIRPGATGDITLQDGQTSNDYIAWSNPTAGPYNPSPIHYDGRLYVLHDRGMLSCFDAQTGRAHYERARLEGANAFTSSPWAARGRVFCMSEDGVCYVVRAGDRFELLRTNRLADDDMCMASPALAGDRMLIRTSERVYCIRAASRA
ncbi:MAG: serine/threonine protein kinase [Armatimonadetes bacterium]|nr:serine/threonine protein kinase [Armatimonadota bacterium]